MESILKKEHQLYASFLVALLGGDRRRCQEMVEKELDGGMGLKSLYLDLFQKSLYEVGERWEKGELSVATEHMATAIVNYLMTLTYEKLLVVRPRRGKAVVACTKGENHFLGARMVADFLESKGFETHFLGPNHEPELLFSLVEKLEVDLVGLSMSMHFHRDRMITTASRLLERKSLTLLLGGLGVHSPRFVIPEKWKDRAHVMGDLDDLEKILPGLVSV